MIDCDKIFDRNAHTTDLGELLMALFDHRNTTAEKSKVWKHWRDEYFSKDALIEFFSDTLFADGKSNYLDAILKCEYKNFYELAYTLDCSGVDPKAYYVYWILCYGHKLESVPHKESVESVLLREALEYDPETIKGMFPDIEEVLFAE